MKRIDSKIWLLALLLVFNLIVLKAEPRRYRVINVPNVHLRDSLRYVSDPERIISLEDRLTLDRKIQEMKDSLKVEIAIVILPYIDTEKYDTAKKFTYKLFNTWGIGDRKTNRGLLILLLTGEGEREVAFETGYGLEGELPDGICKLIQTRKMIPRLEKEEFGAGLIAGLEEVDRVLKGTSTLGKKRIDAPILLAFILGVIFSLIGLLYIWPMARKQKRDVRKTKSAYKRLLKIKNPREGLNWFFSLLFLPIFLIYLLDRWFLTRKVKKDLVCDNCRSVGTVKLKGRPKILKKAVRHLSSGKKEYTFKCKKCNAIYTREYTYKVPKNIMLGGGSNDDERSNRDVRSKGGSWGGGSSGGGGASTKF